MSLTFYWRSVNKFWPRVHTILVGSTMLLTCLWRLALDFAALNLVTVGLAIRRLFINNRFSIGNMAVVVRLKRFSRVCCFGLCSFGFFRFTTCSFGFIFLAAPWATLRSRSAQAAGDGAEMTTPGPCKKLMLFIDRFLKILKTYWFLMNRFPKTKKSLCFCHFLPGNSWNH